jgi:hypothetical protein
MAVAVALLLRWWYCAVWIATKLMAHVIELMAENGAEQVAG